MILSSFLATGCGTVEKLDKFGSGFSKAECATDDWEKLGYEAGKKEASTEKERRLAEYCPDEGYSFNALEYNKGYDRGLKEVCTNDLALKRAVSIFAYTTPCSRLDSYANATKNASKTLEAEANTKIDAYIVSVEKSNALATRMASMEGTSQEYKDSVVLYREMSNERFYEYKALREFIESNNLSLDLLERSPKVKGMPVK